jgi:hypothetical protein
MCSEKLRKWKRYYKTIAEKIKVAPERDAKTNFSMRDRTTKFLSMRQLRHNCILTSYAYWQSQIIKTIQTVSGTKRTKEEMGRLSRLCVHFEHFIHIIHNMATVPFSPSTRVTVPFLIFPLTQKHFAFAHTVFGCRAILTVNRDHFPQHH